MKRLRKILLSLLLSATLTVNTFPIEREITMYETASLLEMWVRVLGWPYFQEECTYHKLIDYSDPYNLAPITYFKPCFWCGHDEQHGEGRRKYFCVSCKTRLVDFAARQMELRIYEFNAQMLEVHRQVIASLFPNGIPLVKNVPIHKCQRCGVMAESLFCQRCELNLTGHEGIAIHECVLCAKIIEMTGTTKKGDGYKTFGYCDRCIFADKGHEEAAVAI